MKVGFIGVGTMGAHMVTNLQKNGFDLVVNDVNQQAASRFITAGAVWAPTPKQVAEQSDVVFSSLPGPPEVEAVAMGVKKHQRRAGRTHRLVVDFPLAGESGDF